LERITASLVTSDLVDGIETLGFSETQSGDGRYVILEKGADDETIYLEIDDQINSGYDAVDGYSVKEGRVELSLMKPVGKVEILTLLIEYPASEAVLVEDTLGRFFGRPGS
jgi:hypothetical protein